MESVGVNLIKTAALGRPFQLGMLYDCRKDELIAGIRLWNKEQLEQNICARPQINTDFTVTASDSIKDKSNLLNIEGALNLSVLGGFVQVSGAAKYLKDTKTSFIQQRLTLHYHSTCEFKELTVNQLPPENIPDDDNATHVVTGILYGADACFVFDRQVSSDEDKSTVKGDVKMAIEKLMGIISADANADLNMKEKQKTEFKNFTCTFYGDFQLPSNPTTFEDAMKVFADLPNLLKDNQKLAVPLRVWLYPLHKLHSRASKLQKDISMVLIQETESVIESLNTAEMKCSDLLQDSPAAAFAAFHDKILQMKQNCYNYKLRLMKKLCSVLPNIRGDVMKETTLNDLLQEHEESPFNDRDLTEWLKERERESEIIKSVLRQLKVYKAQVEVNIDAIMMDLEVGNLVSYTFTSLDCSDIILQKQKIYLSSSTKEEKVEISPDIKQKSWLTAKIQKTMRRNLELFKSLIDSKDCKPTKFIMSSKEMVNNPGSCILLYESESDEAVCYTPPSQPVCPVTEEVKGQSVVLKVVPPSCPATVELRLLYKVKQDSVWRSEAVLKDQHTVTLTDLRSGAEYEIKCAALGKLNYTRDSDIMHVRIIEKKLITALDCVIDNLSFTENKCSELLTDPRTNTFSTFHKKIEDMKRFCQDYRQDFIVKMQSLIRSVQACEEETCALTDLLQAHEESPFNTQDLQEWIREKEKELNTVHEFLQQLLDSGAEVKLSLDTVLSDIKVENVVCYTFSSLEETDKLLSEQEHYLKAQTVGMNPGTSPRVLTWLTGNIREKIRENLLVFKELMTSHDGQSTTFIVSSQDHQNHPGSCILLYEHGCDEAVCFSSPSKPVCPVTEEVTGQSVVLKVVPPSCPATVELRLLYKVKQDSVWRSEAVLKDQHTVTLTDLRSGAEYEIKCAALGKLNYTRDSDIMHVRIIEKKLITALDCVIDNLSFTENKCSELLTDPRTNTFSTFHKKIEDMKRFCQDYRQDFIVKMQSLIRSVQACEEETCALTDLLQAHEKSPFNTQDLQEWIREKEKELNTVHEFLQQLLDSGAEVKLSLDTVLSDIKVENVVCYTFSSLEETDNLLSEQEHYLKAQTVGMNPGTSPRVLTWLTGNIREKIRENLLVFKELMTSHDGQSTTFIVSSQDHQNHPGSCILLYEHGCDEAVCFSSPSKPVCPVTEEVTGQSVVLKVVPPSCPATVELRLLYKVKQDSVWRSEAVLKDQHTVTLTDLRSGAEYEIKCAALGKLNYTRDSDIMHVRIIEKKLITALDCVIDNLSFTENKCSELLTDPRTNTFSTFHKKIEDMKRFCQDYRQDFIVKMQSLIRSVQACEEETCALTDLLQAHEESPFNTQDLQEWIREKEKELNTVHEFLQQLLDSGAEVKLSLDTVLSDIKVENVVCYTFSSLEETDNLLSEQEHYLKAQTVGMNPGTSPRVLTWLTGNIREKIRENLLVFKELMTSHDGQSTTFIVSSQDHQNHPGSCILLYEHGCDEAVCFSSPSKPVCPVTEEVKGQSVVLKVVPPSCPATVELRLLYKVKQDSVWRSEAVLKDQHTVTLTDLRSGAEYEIKCAALGKLNYTRDSDIMHVRIIEKKLITALDCVIDNLSFTENKCSELLTDPRTNTFSTFHKKIEDMKRFCQDYRQDFIVKMQSLIRSVQACEEETCALTDLLQAHEESPFNTQDLQEWIREKEKELNTVHEFLQQLLDSGAEVKLSLDTVLSDIKVENVVCYTFSSLEETDKLLSEQEHYLKAQTVGMNPGTSPRVLTWLTGNIREKIRENLLVFKELMTSHDGQSTTFIVSSQDHQNHPGSCILLYEHGCDEAVCFTPPSQPVCPVTEEVKGQSVVLKVVPPSCPATVELRLLYKVKQDSVWRSEAVLKDQHTVTLTDLRSGAEYEIKCAALGKLNYTRDSDVITVNTERESGTAEINIYNRKKTERGKTEHLFHRLHLHINQRLRATDVLQITEHSLQSHESCAEEELIQTYIQKLLRMNYRARYITNKEISEQHHTQQRHTDSPEDEGDIFESMYLSNEGTSQCDLIHPMDVQMAVFHCADALLKQLMVTKLSQCQFALPLLVPHPFTRQIEFPLWTFRQINKSWKISNTSNEIISQTQPIYTAQTPMVFFFRFGSVSSSKSQLMNSLINERHNTFFHRNCPGSSRSRVLMDGVVEISWFCPSGRDTDKYTECVAFCNLHGDAGEHEKQLQIITDMSSVNVVLLPHLDKNDRNSIILQNLYKHSKPLICLFTEDESALTEMRKGKYKIGLKNRNQSEVSEELRRAINDCLSESSSAFRLEDVSKHLLIRVDEEDDDDCRRGREAAQHMVSLLEKKDLREIKELFLPHQGKLWHQWSQKNRELHQPRGEEIEMDIRRKQTEMKKLRQQQHESDIYEFMKLFIEEMNSNTDHKMFFLKWLRILLDEHTSPDLSALHHKYDEKWSTVLRLKENHDKSEQLKAEQVEFERISEDLQAAAFGVEHIMREIAQIYESCSSVKRNKKDLKDFSSLPSLAAEMMISGFPLELMDGDAAHVPVIWISAVLDQLVQKLGDQRVFVLSVLGLRGSGKSTMMNAMFGLQSAVSAGRTTRGAFMQLIRVSDEMKTEMNTDYILVVNTEGLHAPELSGRSTIHHDNELATFVVGLGNLTLINIFGENPSEMLDVLQIVVQAFLRMKKVRLNPSCVFVHQNVSDITAGERNMEGRRRLQEKLDEMTRLASKDEVCDSESFSDVIRFDVQKDVKYIPHLWEGNPPMAPTNPKYCENIQELKKTIMSDVSKSHGIRLKDLNDRIKDLWEALLNERFVFSFRNTLEISAYRKLETEYRKWSWSLRSAMKETENKLHNRILNEAIHEIEETDLHTELKKTSEEVEKSMSEFFEKDRDKYILIQWKTSFEIKIRDLQENIVRETQRRLNEILQQPDLKKKIDALRTQHENTLYEKSRELALKLRHRTNDEETLKKEFDVFWEQWMKINRDSPLIRDRDIMRDMREILRDIYESRNILSVQSYYYYVRVKRYRGITGALRNAIRSAREIYGLILSPEDESQIRSFVTDVVQQTDRMIQTFNISKMGYNISCIQQITDYIKTRVTQHEEGRVRYVFKNEFFRDLVLSICERANKMITEQHTLFREDNDPVIYLEKKRKEYYSIFLKYCHGATSAAMFGEILCQKLKEPIEQSVYKKTARDIADEMRSNCPSLNGNRSDLEKHILKTLAEEEDFNKYMNYIKTPRDHFKSFIRDEVSRYITDQFSLSVLPKMKENIKLLEQKIMRAAHQSTEGVQENRDESTECVQENRDESTERVQENRDESTERVQENRDESTERVQENRDESTERVQENRDESTEDVQENRDESTERVQENRDESTERVQENRDESTERVQENRDESTERVQENRDESTERVQENRDESTERVQENRDESTERVQENRDESTERVQENRDESTERVQENRDESTERVQENRDESTERVQENRGDVGLWLKSFTQQISDDLIFSEKHLSGVKHDDVDDLNLLEDVIKRELPAIISEISRRFNRKSFDEKLDLKFRPDGLLIDLFCQCCWVQCPFCGATCTNTTEDHPGDHSVAFHRVRGINGYSYRGTTDLCINICTSDVAGDQCFYPDGSDDRVLYRENRRAGGDYEDWSITPDLSELIYWKWFVCRFQRDLEKHYEKTFERREIPEEWKRSTKHDAIESLEKYFKIYKLIKQNNTLLDSYKTI